MKKILFVALSMIMATGCGQASNTQDINETILQMDHIIEEMETSFHSIDQVIKEDLSLEEPKELQYSSKTEIEDLKLYFEQNKSYMTEEITTTYNKHQEKINVYEHLIQYEQRILRTDLGALKEKLHQVILEKQKEYQMVSPSLSEQTEHILQVQEAQVSLFSAIKESSSEVSHLLHNQKEDLPSTTLEQIKTKVKRIDNSLKEFIRTKGEISNLIDQKRKLVQSHDYESLKEQYKKVETTITERITILEQMEKELRELDQLLK